MNTDTKDFTVRDELYTIGQFAKYLSPGDVRLDSSAAENDVSNVVYRSGNGSYVAVLGNSATTDRTVRITVAGHSFVVTVPAGSFATCHWKDRTAADPQSRTP
ncbi:glycoside hydrolase family 30 beta sandwich domain-containing protein [Streptomyces sp. NPDC050743]|uniref:glycoside hydrolase family 30 beta sandwich domain-containing protein n=1 Tax=Streptomyces sp. NPDC050743 TaxID=3365634 RepID=UPI0037A67739